MSQPDLPSPGTQAEPASGITGRSAHLSRHRSLRILWTLFGWLSLAVGFIGVFLPLLPTTPLVLLAAFCFAKGSPRARTWLVNHRIFGPIIADWEVHGAIAPRYKAAACIMMALVLIASLIAELSLMAILIQAVCMSLAALYVLTRPSGARVR
ncbi:MAG: YbaN family protein [Pseudomonadota bacterium]